AASVVASREAARRALGSIARGSALPDVLRGSGRAHPRLAWFFADAAGADPSAHSAPQMENAPRRQAWGMPPERVFGVGAGGAAPAGCASGGAHADTPRSPDRELGLDAPNPLHRALLHPRTGSPVTSADADASSPAPVQLDACMQTLQELGCALLMVIG